MLRLELNPDSLKQGVCVYIYIILYIHIHIYPYKTTVSISFPILFSTGFSITGGRSVRED